MNFFNKLFGLEKESIKANCIVCPANDASLFYSNDGKGVSRGLFYAVSNMPDYTVISTNYNLLAGDCVLALKDSPCRNIFLFGSCGSTGALEVGAAVAVKKAFSLESFSEMLQQKEMLQYMCFEGSGTLLGKMAASTSVDPGLVNCATVSSLMLESAYMDFYRKEDIRCVDMESSMIYSAARVAGKEAASLLYVTDNVKSAGFYEELSPALRGKIKNIRKKLSDELKDFVKCLK